MMKLRRIPTVAGRRTMLVAGLSVLLAACAPPADDGVVDRSQLVPFEVTSLTVDTSAVTQRMLGNALQLADLESDLQGRIAPKLQARSTPGAEKISVNVTVTEVNLISIIEGAIPLVRSKIDAMVTTTSESAQTVDGRSRRFRVPGVLGIVTAPDRATDYRETADGFATAVADAVFMRPDQN